MKFSFKDFTHIKRRFPFPFRVATTGYIEKKDHWVRRRFGHGSFSFILKGKGEAYINGVREEIQAPCTFMKWGDDYLEYGHTRPEDMWDEFYVSFDEESTRYLEQANLIDRNRPVQPLVSTDAIFSKINQLKVLTREHPLELVVDHIDRMAEIMILESQMPRADRNQQTKDPVSVLISMMRRLPNQQYSLSVFAHEHGMSEATLRRRWSSVVGISPRRYLERVRLEKACRMLVETNQPVKAVSAAVGFEDAFYFSRRFQQKFGMSPSDYRKTHGIL